MRPPLILWFLSLRFTVYNYVKRSQGSLLGHTYSLCQKKRPVSGRSVSDQKKNQTKKKITHAALALVFHRIPTRAVEAFVLLSDYGCVRKEKGRGESHNRQDLRKITKAPGGGRGK